MRLVNCPHCRQAAVGPPTAEFPQGVPVLMGRYTGGNHSLVIACGRCKRSFKLDGLSFNALPEITQQQARQMGLHKLMGTTPMTQE